VHFHKKRRPRGVAFYAFEPKGSKWQIVVVVGLVKARSLLRSGTSNGVSSSAKITAALVASVSAATAVVAASLVASVSAATLVSSVSTAAVVAATVSAAVVAV
jgi:hypothetical protein